ncbi:MAG TPA: type II toxin-antitoxin system VapC family toxin [Rhodanobacteraceae bacterium]
MILADTSVWIDHLRRPDRQLSAALAANVVLVHPFVIGELACGALPNHATLLAELAALPQAPAVAHAEVLGLVERFALGGRGIGWIDVHLLASALLAGHAQLWTRDRRLHAVAGEMGVAMREVKHGRPSR